MIRQQMRKMARNVIIFGIGLILFSMVFLRSPNYYYQEVGGRLIPVDPNVLSSISQAQNYQGAPPYGANPYGANPHANTYYGGGQPYNPYPPNQMGYQGYTQVTANPYTPPDSNYYSRPQHSPSFPRSQGDSIYNPRMQSNYVNRSGNAPSDM